MSKNTRETGERSIAEKWLTPRNLSFALIGLQILVAIVTYPFLPEKVASHWGMSGQVDGSMSRFWNAIFLPSLSIVMYVCIRVLVLFGPSLGSAEARQASQKLIDQFLVVLLLFLFVIQGAIDAFALGYAIDIFTVINVVVALLFIVIGNYLGKVPRNFWAGIRTPWTLANDSVWERTHRLGSWLFVLAGLLTILLNFLIPSMRAMAVMVPIILVIGILVLYSYVCFQDLAKKG